MSDSIGVTFDAAAGSDPQTQAYMMRCQTTAVIVAAYLKHTTKVFEGYLSAGKATGDWTVNRDELKALVDQVQNALTSSYD